MTNADAATTLFVIDRAGGMTPLIRPADFRPETHLLAALTPDTRPLLARALGEHPVPGGKAALTLLVTPCAAPEAKCSKEVVTAFIATGDWARELIERDDGPAGDLCYRALATLLAAPDAAARLRIVDRAVPVAVPSPPMRRPTIDVMLPHRGSDAQLLGALDSLSGQTLRGRTILCFDQYPDPALVRRLARRADVALYQVLPDPAGPYVPRQHFALTSTARYVAFQDSDDISLPARFASLAAYAERYGIDMVGSHELRCDEINRRVAAIRYPLDVNRALDLGDGSVQLFPATLVCRRALQRLGGFSTDRRYAADRQFQLRAHGRARIVNLDAFLYVRRRRAQSLSTSAETGMASPERIRINRAWDAAFDRVRRGAPERGEPALAVAPAGDGFAIRNLRTGRVEPAILSWREGGRTAQRVAGGEIDPNRMLIHIDDIGDVADTRRAARPCSAEKE